MMKNYKCLVVIGVLFGWLVGSRPAVAEEAKPLYENNFEQEAVGSVPTNVMVLDGGFAVKEEGGNKFLELPGAPLDTFGVLFGPTEKSDVEVTARIKGTNKGRRYPTFGVGLNGQGGYKLRVSPGKKALEIYKGDEVVASAPYDWKSGQWTIMRLQVLKIGDVWKVKGSAWQQGMVQPPQAAVAFEDKEEPSAGRASIWGSPYATTPIQFDDLMVTSAAVTKQ
jgi:hypothetical protein